MPHCRKVTQDVPSDRRRKDLNHRVWSNLGGIIVDRWSMVDGIDEQLNGIRGGRNNVKSVNEKTPRIIEADQAET